MDEGIWCLLLTISLQHSYNADKHFAFKKLGYIIYLKIYLLISSGVAKGAEGANRPGGSQDGTAKKGVKFNKSEISKIVVTCVKHRFVDFCFQRKGTVINSTAVAKTSLIERTAIRVSAIRHFTTFGGSKIAVRHGRR